MLYDSIDINEILTEELGNQPIVIESEHELKQDTVSNIAERHWGNSSNEQRE